ncbi:ribonuclease III [Marinicauda salina]|uniref:Ribonuclease 3 n=1 Tax=Marinicauda salina TaxID=2135793 RepID=A0A2U2BVI7_9PROT|nr:ribonuclease III [Marinicauda salina]PWE18035.1 ribonuclease III [Marinicauda salina]
MADTLDLFQDEIGYRFGGAGLLELALTHASHGDGRARSQSNERLEFLGDRVLGLLAAERLYEAFGEMDEGGLAHRLNAIVNKDACARAAERCNLGAALRLSPAEERLGGREKPSILADACEAVIGALYLDGGLEAARDFFERYWGEDLDGLLRRPKDPKSRLQEWAAQRGLGTPAYETVGRKGPDHRPVFTVSVSLPGAGEATGEGASKQDAQRAAAAALLEKEHVDER